MSAQKRFSDQCDVSTIDERSLHGCCCWFTCRCCLPSPSTTIRGRKKLLRLIVTIAPTISTTTDTSFRRALSFKNACSVSCVPCPMWCRRSSKWLFLCLSLMLPSMRLVLLSRCAKATFIQRVRHLRFNLCGFSENILFFGVSYARKTYDFQRFMMRNAKLAFAWLPFPIPFPHVLASAHSAVSFAKKMVRSENLSNNRKRMMGDCVSL